MDFVPDESAIKTEYIEVDKETMDMLAALGMADVPGLVKVDPVSFPVQPMGVNRGAGGAGRRYWKKKKKKKKFHLECSIGNWRFGRELLV